MFSWSVNRNPNRSSDKSIQILIETCAINILHNHNMFVHEVNKHNLILLYISIILLVVMHQHHASRKKIDDELA